MDWQNTLGGNLLLLYCTACTYSYSTRPPVIQALSMIGFDANGRAGEDRDRGHGWLSLIEGCELCSKG